MDNILKESRKRLNLTMLQVANYVGVSEGTISRWESGNIANMKRDKIAKLSEILQIRPSVIMGIYDSSVDNQPIITENYVTFPVIGDVAAGYELVASEEWTGEKIEIPVSYLKGRNATDFFALQVKGDSMYPLYLNGDIVLVLKSSSVERSGNIGVVIYDDDNGTLKRIEFDDTHTWLRLSPVNPEYQPRELTGEKLDHCRIIGVPRLLIREVEN